MRAFIVLCCLATAYAASTGYNYDRANVGFGSDQGYNSGSSFGGSNLGGSIGDNNGGSGGFGPAGGSEVLSAPAEFTKEFYSYTAPEGAFDDNSGIDQLGNSLKRNLRVVFIKGPENSGLENAALQLAKSAAAQRTAIYVLNKQADIGDLANKLNNLNKSDNNKPEVHFVKYRTPADAENAQRVIQSQYDALGGKSNSINGGVAPVLDFASKTPSGGAHQSAEQINSYLPPNKRV